jgi:hypothetical protein
MFLHKGDWDDSPYSDVPLWDDCGDDVDGDGDRVWPDLRSTSGHCQSRLPLLQME